jgi:hypothetical protein
MTHEVYISFDDLDKLSADIICQVLEDNGIECWIRLRDVKDYQISEMDEALKKSKVMALVYSRDAKNSNQVYTEALTAFDNEIPIVVVNVDNNKLTGGLEFLLNNVNHWLNILPQPEMELRNLVINVSKLLKRPVTNPKISPNVKLFIDELDVENVEDPKARKRKVILLLVFTIFIPLILIAISFATFDISGNFGILLFLLAFVFLIGTPIFYFIYSYMIK